MVLWVLVAVVLWVRLLVLAVASVGLRGRSVVVVVLLVLLGMVLFRLVRLRVLLTLIRWRG
jgi:hypothetical protein